MWSIPIPILIFFCFYSSSFQTPIFSIVDHNLLYNYKSMVVCAWGLSMAYPPSMLTSTVGFGTYGCGTDSIEIIPLLSLNPCTGDYEHIPFCYLLAGCPHFHFYITLCACLDIKVIQPLRAALCIDELELVKDGHRFSFWCCEDTCQRVLYKMRNIQNSPTWWSQYSHILCTWGVLDVV